MNTKTMFSSKSNNWETPQDLFEQLSIIHGKFDLDVCANEKNTKCKKYYSEQDNALNKSWHKDGQNIWMNPPYGRQIGLWVRKAFIESLHGCKVVCLLPAQTDTKWFHEFVLKCNDLVFLKGRIKFGEHKNSAPFPSMIVVFGRGTKLSEDD